MNNIFNGGLFSVIKSGIAKLFSEKLFAKKSDIKESKKFYLLHFCKFLSFKSKILSCFIFFYFIVESAFAFDFFKKEQNDEFDFDPSMNTKTFLQQDAEHDKFLQQLDQRGNAFCLIRYPRIANGIGYDAISYWRCRKNYLEREIIRLKLTSQYDSQQLLQYTEQFKIISDYILRQINYNKFTSLSEYQLQDQSKNTMQDN